MANYLKTQPYKGTRDFYPSEKRLHNWIFKKMQDVVQGFGYEEYDGPMLESFDLYAAKTGEEIVNQQLYWFEDRGGRKLAVRPEMTPTLARMVAGKFNELPKPVRWFSFPNLWRYERPQRGRLREHWQLNVDVLGGDRLLADAEILTLSVDLIRAFGGEEFVEIKVNHRQIVDDFFKKLGLSSEQALAATKALDARAKIGEEKYSEWLKKEGLEGSQIARMETFFQADFEEAKSLVDSAGIAELETLFGYLEDSGVLSFVKFDPMIMRGMDYYTGTVFEMYDKSPENNRAMFGGGRYDNLIGLFGKNQLSGVGFGMGDVTLTHFLETHGLVPPEMSGVDVFLGLPKVELRKRSEDLGRVLRAAGFKVATPLGIDGFGAQLKTANKLGARYAILWGEEELKAGNVIIKDLSKGEQVAIAEAKVLDFLNHQK